jgi:hypothetical protein
VSISATGPAQTHRAISMRRGLHPRAAPYRL